MDRTTEAREPMTAAALRQLLDVQQEQLTALRAEVGRLRETEPAPAGRQKPAAMGRRALFGKAAAVLAAGAGLAVGGAQPAFAGTDGDVVLGSGNNKAGPAATWIESTSGFFALGGYNSDLGAGLDGYSSHGTGVNAHSGTGNALTASAESSGNAFNAIYGTSAGTGNGVFGETTNTANTGNGLLGINHGPGNCVYGVKPAGVAGDAVVGVANGGRGVLGVSKTGRGGAFSGGRAQIQLVPSTAATHPASGTAGDLFVDSGKRLWFCKGTTNWQQIA